MMNHIVLLVIERRNQFVPVGEFYAVSHTELLLQYRLLFPGNAHSLWRKRVFCMLVMQFFRVLEVCFENVSNTLFGLVSFLVAFG